MTDDAANVPSEGLTVLSLFSGIGALDRGLELAGNRVIAMCESWAPARRVLNDRYSQVHVFPDVRTLKEPPSAHVLAAGFPCTDISHAGAKAGIMGPASGLVDHVFRIADEADFDWILLENVPNLLTLQNGAGMRHITDNLENLGYRWAYRTVDSRFTGVPQRRPRVILLASREKYPDSVLLRDDATFVEPIRPDAYGFYWTEGRNGLGFVPGAVPTLKGGSTIGLPSAPAVWLRHRAVGNQFLLPSIEDGEALQGLPRGWTAAATVDDERDSRWKLVGNSVTVGVAEWVGGLLRDRASEAPNQEIRSGAPEIDRDRRWPPAGFGGEGAAYSSSAGLWPRVVDGPLLSQALGDQASPLSHRATKGFLSRLDDSQRAVDPDFYAALEAHLSSTRPPLASGGATTARGAQMGGVAVRRPRDGSVEPALRRALHARGLRYRLQVRPLSTLRRRADVAFTREKVAVDIRSCFWHGCPDHGSTQGAYAERWSDKVARNIERDEAMADELGRHGWIVVVAWEHDHVEAIADRVERLVTARRDATSVKNQPSAAVA